MDLRFLAKGGSDTSLTVLVLKNLSSRAILAYPVLRKGRLREDSAEQDVPSAGAAGKLGLQ
eukprot:1726363-Alexandrium_andersonii.AAC.1